MATAGTLSASMALSLLVTRAIKQTKIEYGNTFFYVTPHSLKMPSTMSLNTRVHIVSKLGKKETITVRDLLARGTGSSFEAIQMLDEYEHLAEAYKAEVAAAAAEKDREDHLPLGSHLLPQDYQDFLYSWNKTIATAPGCSSWNGADRQTYKGTNKEAWAKWVAQNKEFRKRYAAEVEQVIAYQASHEADTSSENSDDELHSLNMDPFPSLPPSPIAMMEQPDTNGEDEAEPEAEAEAESAPEPEAAETVLQEDLSMLSGQQLRDIWADLTGRPKGLKSSGKLYNKQLIIQQIQLLRQSASEPQLDEQPDTDGEAEAEAEAEGPKRTRNPIYTNYKWPSPLAKVFVQEIRGGNAWNYSYKGRDPWPVSFRYFWTESGNTEFRLTHDNCMRYLARRMSLSLEQLMEKTPHEVHAKLIGTRHGVKGYYTRYW